MIAGHFGYGLSGLGLGVLNQNTFDEEFYMALYPDVKNHAGYGTAPHGGWIHYRDFGIKEGRQAREKIPLPTMTPVTHPQPSVSGNTMVGSENGGFNFSEFLNSEVEGIPVAYIAAGLLAYMAISKR